MSCLGLVMEERFFKAPGGEVFSHSGYTEAVFEPYLETFDQLVIIARLGVIPGPDEAGDRAPISDPRIRFHPVPYYVGMGALARRFPAVIGAVNAALGTVDAVMLRMPGALGLISWPLLRLKRAPCAVELIGDPAGVFGAGGVGGAAAPVYRIAASALTRRLCRRADAISYVSQHVLQAAYPPSPDALKSHYSDVALAASDFRGPEDRSAAPGGGAIRLFAAGSLETLYKGPDVLIESMRRLRSEGLDVLVRWAGDGRRRAEVEALAREAGLAEAFECLGALSRAVVLDEMRGCDLYVQPSRTEGLPRAIIEACAQSAPVVSTSVGGVPELLDAEWCVPPGDADALAEAVRRMVRDPEARRAASMRNFAIARDFEHDRLSQRRQAFMAAFRALADTRSAKPPR